MHWSKKVRTLNNVIVIKSLITGNNLYLGFLSRSNSLTLSSEEQSRLAARKYARVVQKLGFPAKFLDFKIQNMVGSCDVKFPIRLEGLVLTHQQFSR